MRIQLQTPNKTNDEMIGIIKVYRSLC